jgi:drug/metabolite transporter (DMT)-like permease
MTKTDEAQPRATGLPLSNILLVLLLGVVWGVNWPAIRVSVLEIEPWTFRTICLGAGASVLVIVARARRQSLRVPRAEILPLIAVGLLNVTAYHMLTAYGLTRMDAARGAILTFTFPLWSVLLGAIVLRERITLERFAALLLGLSAMVLLIGPDLATMGQSPVGGLLLIAAAIAWACATLLMKSRHWTIGAIELATWQLIIGFVPIAIGTLFIGEPPDFTGLSVPAWTGLIYGSAIAVGFGQWIWFRILETTPSAVASLSTLAVPIVGVFSAGWLLGEHIGWRELIALLLVVLSLFLTLIGRDGARAILRLFR